MGTTWRPDRSAWWQALHELLAFGWKEALACGFALFIFLCLGLTKLVVVPGVPRYDLLLVLCLLFQVALLRLGVETRDELKVITLFHGLGLALELWKVHLGSWSYPGEAWTKVGGVPLFGGFMYAAVGSFVAQSWRRLDLRLEGAPPAWQAGLVCAGIYGNFFTNRHLPDVRGWLFLLVAVVFRRTFVRYRPCEGGPDRRMPLLVSFLLVGLFVWFAEQLATLLGAWRYPNQHHGWRPVYWQKLTSWWLLVILSIVLVAELVRRRRLLDPVGEPLGAGAAVLAPAVDRLADRHDHAGRAQAAAGEARVEAQRLLVDGHRAREAQLGDPDPGVLEADRRGSRHEAGQVAREPLADRAPALDLDREPAAALAERVVELGDPVGARSGRAGERTDPEPALALHPLEEEGHGREVGVRQEVVGVGPEQRPAVQEVAEPLGP